MAANGAMLSTRHLAERLPDVPRWVEARDYLLSGECEISGLEETPELALVVRDPRTGFVMIVGAPNADAIREAASASCLVPDSNLIAAPEHGDHVAAALPGWSRTRAILHLLRRPEDLPPAGSSDVRFVDRATLATAEAIPAGLRRELEQAAETSPIAAAFVEGHPVAFCYAGSITESLWDISIDTLADHRRRGHAARAVAHMIRHMQARGKSPVWAALEDNAASWRLAQKLGFEAVDELAFFEPPAC
jgi:RimJ/RimL family protein N-acetyltransferase